MKISKKREMIVKSNHLVEARYKLTTLEQKLILMMVSHIQPDDIDFKRYVFPLKDISEFLGISYKSIYDDIIVVCRRLMKRILTIHKPTSILDIHWVSSAEYFMGEVSLTFHPDLKPYLLQLKNKFISYTPDMLKQIKSSYSIRLYELLKQYERIGKRYFLIPELRDILGIRKDEYQRYYNFKIKVLDRAMNEINKNTDITISYIEVKKHKTTTGIEYIINSNKPVPQQTSETPSQNNLLMETLVNQLFLSQQQAQDIMDNYDEKYIGDQIDNILNIFKSSKIKNKGAYAYKAIIEGYTYDPTIQETIKETQEKQKKEELIQSQYKIFESEKDIKIATILGNLSPQDKDELLQSFEAQHIKPYNKKTYESDGVESPILQGIWHKFVCEKYMKTCDYIFHEWLENSENI
jgi:plasmid replication initiation protein